MRRSSVAFVALLFNGAGLVAAELVCQRRFGAGTCKTWVDRALSLGCKGIEALFERLGGSVTEAQKEELRRQCSASADKPL